jgi:serine/threonine protein kinase
VSAPLFAPGTDVQGAAGRYRIEAHLGRGGFGDSFRARAASGAAVTLKVLRLERLESWKALDLFDREARALAVLDHPRLPRLVELFVTDGERASGVVDGETVTAALERAPGGARVVLVQSYIPGRSLQATIDAGERLGRALATDLARDLLEILDHLHRGDPPIIHRDLKPSNVILDGEGRAHLIDFGAIQTRLRAAAESGSTMVGTIGYFPHEQILGRAVPASDLYALGMTLLVALTGQPPEALPHDEATGKIRPPDGLPPPLARLLHAVLEPAPGARPPSARAALQLLDGHADIGPPGVVTPVGAPPPALSPDAARRQRWLYRLVLAGSLGGAALVHTLWSNAFSESALVAIAPFWVTPAVFGAAGLWALPRPSAPAVATIAAVVGLLALMFFLYGIFPSL